MTGKLIDRVEDVPNSELLTPIPTQYIFYSVGVMAYNEEGNIRRSVQAILQQQSEKTRLTEIIVVASGCTDNTVSIIREMQATEPCIKLIEQPKREGKASAINLFLQAASSPVLVMIGADIIPEKDTLEKLCTHFENPKTGMVGGHPVPVNDPYTFIGHAVHLQWKLHDRMARRTPKLGEIVAFRNVISHIPTDTAVDEISIESLIARQKLKLVYEPEAMVYNKGPMTVQDFLKQRRRIHAGHLKVRSQTRYEASTMKVGPVIRELFSLMPYTASTPQQLLWTLGTIALEGVARLQGHYDVLRKRSHHVWQAVSSTKVLEDEQRKLRRICNTQSVIVFHISREGQSPFASEREQAQTLQLVRKILPTLRKYVRRDDILSINGPDMLIAVLNADKMGADLAAQRIREVLMSQRIRINRKEYTRLLVNSHAVSFAD